MGIVNVTPDSFSDGGQHFDPAQAIAHGLRLIVEGADILDIGGESTRPGAAPVDEQAEIARVTPIIAALREKTSLPISIDTMKPAVARAAFAAGATIWNDVAGMRDDASIDMAAALNAPVIVMHMQGEPRTMQAAPHYQDVVQEVGAFLCARVAALATRGVHDVWVDPGIGFGKTLDHNLALMRAIPDLKEITRKPLLFGASRKSFIAKVEERANLHASPADQRVGGSLAAALHAARAGANVLRVHDVHATVQALAVLQAIEGE
jgi:dihydropteroate synthase